MKALPVLVLSLIGTTVQAASFLVNAKYQTMSLSFNQLRAPKRYSTPLPDWANDFQVRPDWAGLGGSSSFEGLVMQTRYDSKRSEYRYFITTPWEGINALRQYQSREGWSKARMMQELQPYLVDQRVIYYYCASNGYLRSFREDGVTVAWEFDVGEFGAFTTSVGVTWSNRSGQPS